MNRDETWQLQLWSGSIGALVAAIIGGLVALLVVRLTNAQQRRQASEAREVNAIADIGSLCMWLIMDFDSKDIPLEPNSIVHKMEAAVIRLKLSSSHAMRLGEAFDGWTFAIVNNIILFRVAESREHPLVGRLKESVEFALIDVPQQLEAWRNGSPKEREAVLRDVRYRIKDLQLAKDLATEQNLHKALKQEDSEESSDKR